MTEAKHTPGPRLIAAAPDMLDALKNARSMLVAFGGDPRTVIAEFGSAAGDEMQAALLDVIDAAIAKATGAAS